MEMLSELSHNTNKSAAEKTHGQYRPNCRLIMSYVASDLGLLSVFVAYTIGGAFLFIYLEQYIQLQNCELVTLAESISVETIAEDLYYYVVSSTDNITVIYAEIVNYLENFTSDIYDRKNNYSYTGEDCFTVSDWMFSSALFFTTTTIATIGFGNVVPVSSEGQITCICYSLIGIPIFLMCLTRISVVMSDIFRFGYSGFLNCICCYCRIHSYRIKTRFKQTGKPSNTNDFDYLGTISLEPSWPETNDQLNTSVDDIDTEFDESWYRLKTRVPILVIIAIIVGYLLLGALMCHQFEGWTMIESIYFCYIALSTIGFGDYVPTVGSDTNATFRFIAISVYIVVGLAVLAMSFELMTDSIVDKFEWFARRFSLVAHDDDQIDDDNERYANFEYSQNQEKTNNKIQSKDEFYDVPIAYDFISTDGQWLSNIRDKDESNNQFSNITRIT